MCLEPRELGQAGKNLGSSQLMQTMIWGKESVLCAKLERKTQRVLTRPLAPVWRMNCK